MTSAFFRASFSCLVGDGRSILFWNDLWLEGKSIQDIAPNLWMTVPNRYRRNRTITATLLDNAWIRDIVGPFTVPILVQYVQLRERLLEVALNSRLRTGLCGSGVCLANTQSQSAYSALFLGQTAMYGEKQIWKIRPPAKCHVSLAGLARQVLDGREKMPPWSPRRQRLCPLPAGYRNHRPPPLGLHLQQGNVVQDVT
jgi:hypothetical protein